MVSECVIPSEKELRRFMRETYGPEWENKLELAKSLWKKKFCKKKSFTGQIVGGDDRKYVKKSIDEIGDRELVEVVGIVIDRDFFKYMGCPICYKSVRSGCEHLNAGQEPVELAITKVVISDGTGDLNVSTLLKPEDEDPFEGVDVGFVLKIQGYARVVGGEKRMYVNNVEIIQKVEGDDAAEKEEKFIESKDKVLRIDDINNPNVQSFLRYLINSGGMKKEIAEMMMDRKGITWDDIRDYVVIDDEIVSVKEGVI